MTRDLRPTSVSTPRAIVGLIVVVVGLTFLGDNLGLIRAEEVLRLWPFALILIGLSKLFQGESVAGRVFGAVLVFLGGLGVADEFLHLSVDVWRWWPLAIVAFGVLIVMKGLRSDAARSSDWTRASPGISVGAGVRSDATTTAESTASEIAVWSGVKRRVASPAFRSATLTAVMGGIEFDLRPAATATGEAVIEVFAVWGGIEITVPPDWSVTTQVVPVLGGVQDRSSGTQAARHHLVVKGAVVMGGVEIKT